ncbi:phosphohistidine phosphatase [Kordiimonas sediminis]|uniref:Phosphohistidine phosphatase n=1 Tax=Kordiimonas sediminis TaxID=1735581 RepID=A0A919AKI7_9PROT|nr:histidine phosphatase family protein [Kordiimonas sediminis]GHF13132.1 phosphohistidine phosphatase [Kordiimonas sediminis]
MKKIFLLRHAKSDWEDMTQDDFSRPLNARGRQASSDMGRYFLAQGIEPDMVLCSSAARTRETEARLKQACNGGWDCQFLDDLYLAPSHSMLQTLRGVPDDFASVLLIGHNPGIHDLAMQLVKDGEKVDMANLARKYPTCTLSAIKVPVSSFADLTIRKGRLNRFVRPKDLDAMM